MPPPILNSLKRWLRPPPVDVRSGRFVAVIECILNQNARDDGAACSPERPSADQVGEPRRPLKWGLDPPGCGPL